jgi:hypothetical protein
VVAVDFLAAAAAAAVVEVGNPLKEIFILSK